jgi:hypothetical protein
MLVVFNLYLGKLSDAWQSNLQELGTLLLLVGR